MLSSVGVAVVVVVGKVVNLLKKENMVYNISITAAIVIAVILARLYF